ncbi:hypothetical protein AB9K41_01615, partial [Cribrihabitans sp. XS_ASV171]
MRIESFLIATLFPTLVWSQQPLSAIDWLDDTPQVTLPDTMVMEPPVSPSGERPEVDVLPLEALSPPVGLVSPSVTG